MLVLARDHYLTVWTPGEIVSQRITVYLPDGPPGSLEAHLRLTPWGVGPPLDTVARLRLPE